MELVVISEAKKNEIEHEFVTKMFEAGLQTYHLRKPRFSTNQLKSFIEKIPTHFHNRIIIHSHHDLLFKYGLKGIHFTETHLERKFQKWWTLRRIRSRKKNVIITRSYKKISEVYNEEEIAYSYYLIGTIFNTLNNEFYSGYYEQGIVAAINTSGKKFVARGGINEKTIVKAYKLGFYGAALSSILWKAENPFEKYLEILNHCKNEGIKID